MGELEDLLELGNSDVVPNTEFLAVDSSKKKETIESARTLINERFGNGSPVHLDGLQERLGVVRVHLSKIDFLDGSLYAIYRVDEHEKVISDAISQITFFKGICYILTGNLKTAIKNFDVIINDMNPSYYDEAIYFKGIALVRLNRIKEAKQNLENLAQMFSPYASRAQFLLEKINTL